MDYGKSVERAAGLGRYYFADLAYFNCPVSTEEVLCELDRMGYRPAELHELLYLNERYPSIQNEFNEFFVVALGSVWRDQNNYCRVAYLDESSVPNRYLYLDNIYRKWHGFSIRNYSQGRIDLSYKKITGLF